MAKPPLVTGLCVCLFAAGVSAQTQASGQKAASTVGEGTGLGQTQTVSAAINPMAQRTRFGGIARVAYRQLAILDEDPRNDMSLRYMARGLFPLGPLRGFAQVDVTQRFIAEVDDSAYRIEDFRLGAVYNHSTGAVAGLGPITLVHQASVFFPTSRLSRINDVVGALSFVSDAFAFPLKSVMVGATANLKWQWARYAERAGAVGGMLDRVVGDLRLYAMWTALDHALGQVNLIASVFGGGALRYASAESYRSALSSEVYGQRTYGWDAGLWLVPHPRVSVYAAVTQGGLVRDDGVINLYLARREETEFNLSITTNF